MSLAFVQHQKGRAPPNPTQIQKLLDENTQLIQVIMDYQNKGKGAECVQYQQVLHRNLVYLASIADSSQNIQALLPAPQGMGSTPNANQQGMPQNDGGNAVSGQVTAPQGTPTNQNMQGQPTHAMTGYPQGQQPHGGYIRHALIPQQGQMNCGPGQQYAGGMIPQQHGYQNPQGQYRAQQPNVYGQQGGPNQPATQQYSPYPGPQNVQQYSHNPSSQPNQQQSPMAYSQAYGAPSPAQNSQPGYGSPVPAAYAAQQTPQPQGGYGPPPPASNQGYGNQTPAPTTQSSYGHPGQAPQGSYPAPASQPQPQAAQQAGYGPPPTSNQPQNYNPNVPPNSQPPQGYGAPPNTGQPTQLPFVNAPVNPQGQGYPPSPSPQTQNSQMPPPQSQNYGSPAAQSPQGYVQPQASQAMYRTNPPNAPAPQGGYGPPQTANAQQQQHYGPNAYPPAQQAPYGHPYRPQGSPVTVTGPTSGSNPTPNQMPPPASSGPSPNPGQRTYMYEQSQYPQYQQQ